MSLLPIRRKAAMPSPVYPSSSPDIARKRKQLAPEIEAAFEEFSHKVFAEGALSAKMKQVIAVAAAHVTQCPYCIRGHTKAALRHGATHQELMEAIWVAAEMRAGGAYAHSTLSLTAMTEEAESHTNLPAARRTEDPPLSRSNPDQKG